MFSAVAAQNIFGSTKHQSILPPEACKFCKNWKKVDFFLFKARIVHMISNNKVIFTWKFEQLWNKKDKIAFLVLYNE